MKNEKFIRKYRLTLGTPLSFYKDDVGKTPFADKSETAIRGLSIEDRVKYENNYTNSRFLYDKFSSDKFDGVILEDLHIDFHLEEGAGEDCSYITLYNISEKVKGYLKDVGKLPTAIKLECGYVSDTILPLIFQGEVIRVYDKFEGPTRATKLIVKTGASNIKEAYTVRAYKKGTSVETLVKELIADMKLPYGTVYIPRVNENAIVIDKNFYANGKTVDIIKALCDNYGLVFSIVRTVAFIGPKTNENRLDSPDKTVVTYDKHKSQLFGSETPLQSVLGNVAYSKKLAEQERTEQLKSRISIADNHIPARKGYKYSTEDGLLISNKDGTLVGYPCLDNGNEASLEQEGSVQEKIRFKTLMNGALTVGMKIKLESRYYNGIYNIEKVIFKGQYEGSDWYVECIAALAESYSSRS